jgi:predicted metalloprotease with PDZ domain
MAVAFRAKTGYVTTLKLETFSHANIRLDRDPFSALGMRFLSRYNVRLDFVGSRAYFLAGNRFAAPEPVATSGLAILQMNGEKVICAVEPAGPAAALGIAPGDVIMALEGRDAHEHDMVSLHEVLTREAGASVPMKLNRNGQTFEVAVQLESRLILHH